MNLTLRSIIYVFVGVLFAKILSVCTSMYVARTLQPEDYGVWVTLMLIASYAGIAHVGTIEALLKQYPYLKGRGEDAEAQDAERNAMGAITVAAILLVAACLLLPRLAPAASRETYFPLVRLMLATAALSLFSTYFYHRFAAHQEFKMVSITDTTRAVYTAVLLVSLSWCWGVSGTVWGFFLAELLVCLQSAILGRRVCGRIGFDIDRKQIWELIKLGFPITIVWWVCILQQTSDRLITMALLGKVATGYYGLGVSIVFTLVLIPQVVGQVLYPKINDGVGRGLEQEQMEQLIVTPARAFSLLLPLAIGLLIILAPVIYNYLFPTYMRGLMSAQILLAGSYFLCLFKNGANFLIANNRQNLVLWYAASCLVFNVAATFTAVRLGADIEGVALSSALSSALLTTMIWKKVFAVLGHKPAGQLKQLFQLYLPFLLLLVLIGAWWVLSPYPQNWTGMIPLYNSLLFAALMIVLIMEVPPLSRWSRELCVLLRVNMASRQ